MCSKLNTCFSGQNDPILGRGEALLNINTGVVVRQFRPYKEIYLGQILFIFWRRLSKWGGGGGGGGGGA